MSSYVMALALVLTVAGSQAAAAQSGGAMRFRVSIAMATDGLRAPSGMAATSPFACTTGTAMACCRATRSALEPGCRAKRLSLK